jgi:hypothetical protein
MDRHDPRHGPMDAAIREQGSSIGKIIAGVLPPGWGFALLIFPFNEGGGRMNYISNAPREDMLVALKELVARMEGNFDDKGGRA